MSSSALLGEPMMQAATISLRLVRSPACSASSTSWSRRALIGMGRLSPTGRSGHHRFRLEGEPGGCLAACRLASKSARLSCQRIDLSALTCWPKREAKLALCGVFGRDLRGCCL